MKRLYEKSVRLQSVIRTWPSYGESENTLSAGLVRKLMWLIASIVLDKDFFYGKFDAVIPIPKKTISVKKSGDIIKAAQHIVDGAYSRDKENLCPGFDIGEDLCYQFFDDTISLGEVCGKYWNTEVWGNTTLLSNDLEFYDFNDFFQKLSETKCSVTPELFAEWRAILQDFVTEFIPPCIASDMVELLLKKRRKLFFETISTEPHLEVFKKDFEWDTINMMVDILRFGENNSDKEIRELSKEMCIRGFREQFHLEEEISDEEVLACFKALYDQPLMVNMATAEGGTFEYAILKSKSLGFLLSNRDNQEFWDSLSDEVQEDLGQFYKLVPEDNVIFPYIHTTNSVAADVYYSDTIYICGMYTSGMYLSGRDGWNQNFETGGCLVLPSLADMTLLRWADMLYDTILSNNHSEGYQEAAL